MGQLGYEPKTSLKPLHYPALSTFLVLPYGFSVVLQTVIYRSDVDVFCFLFPHSFLCVLLIQGLMWDAVIWYCAVHSKQISDTFDISHTALGDSLMINK
jgi:hypothetical protein